MARPALDRRRLVPIATDLRQRGWSAPMIAARLGISERSTKSLLAGVPSASVAVPRRRLAAYRG